MIQGCTNQIKAPEFTRVWESKGEMVQRCHGPLFLYLTLRWASQPKGDCKVYYHSAELLHLPNSMPLSRERFTALSGIWGEKWSEDCWDEVLLVHLKRYGYGVLTERCEGVFIPNAKQIFTLHYSQVYGRWSVREYSPWINVQRVGSGSI